MKRKNILKFVSLLGIGSFVMLAAASCSQAATRTPSSNSSSSNTNSMPAMNNTPSSGANQGMMNAAAKELSDAKAALMTLLSDKSNKVELYSDYAKIQNVLSTAYSSAEAISQNQSATLEQVKGATSALEMAINTADASKKKFDQDHSDLLMPYKELKDAVAKKQTTVMGLTDSKYSGILNHINGESSKGEELVKNTLDPVSGSIPQASSITEETSKIQKVLGEEELKKWKDNAEMFANFKAFTLDKAKLAGVDENKNMKQPDNYSFVAYGVDVTGNDNSNMIPIPNWSFAQRAIFNNTPASKISPTTQEGESTAQPLSNVSWIYSLTGSGAKYTLDFTYYGPSTGYLYFPYKLVKAADSTMVGLQYKLNEGEAKEVNFKQAITTSSTSSPEAATTASSIRLVDSHEAMGSSHSTNEAPTVGDINVAKLTLANLKFGENKIEFSVPNSKVAPMFGNMYLSSSSDTWNEVYDDIFGNSVMTTENNNIQVSVDTLKAYSLANDWSTVISQYAATTLMLDEMMVSGQKFYLIGFVGGNSERDTGPVASVDGAVVRKMPTTTSNVSRTYTFYVNAPQEGQYYIKGFYASGANRGLKFMTGDSSSDNHVTITNLNSTDFNTKLKTFDTSKADSTLDNNMKNTLMLKKGLNKIVVSGVESVDSGNAPNFGHLSFTLMNPTTSEESK